MDKKVFFTTSDGLKLCGILSVSVRATDKCVALCHGLAVTKEEDGIFTKLSDKLRETGFHVFRFDFRGHGESDGKQEDMTVAGELVDLEAAVKFLQGRGYRHFGIVAASFAGGAASLFVNKNQNLTKGLVLWNSLIDYSSMISPVTDWQKKYWGKTAFNKAEKDGFAEVGSAKFQMGKALAKEMQTLRPWQYLRGISTPMLFIHGDKDNHVPFGDSVKYSKMFNAKLIIIDGATHGFHDKKEYSAEADTATIEFFKNTYEDRVGT